ncbi:MAG: hypothetical protein WCL04_06375 [Verrucomicrobiota bacterium]
MLQWLAATVFGQFFKELLGAMAAGLQQQQTRADQIALGQQRQATADTVAALDAAKRIEAAGIQAHDVAATEGRLGNGTF